MWPFNKPEKSDLEKAIDDLNDLNNQLNQANSQNSSFANTVISGSAGIQNSGGAGSSGNANNIGSVQIGGVGGIYTTTGTSITLPGAFGHYESLTPQESSELESLKKDNVIETKIAKLTEFKKLPTQLRQFVINACMWQDTVQKINEITAPESDRQKELAYKDQHGKLLTTQGWSVSVNSFINSMTSISLPNDLTTDDLKNAHAEQAIEEEMLDEKA